MIEDLRNYVNQQDSSLTSSISNLKSYVDHSDNENKSYFTNLINKQGVSLTQLNDYYNHLLKGMAEISIEKGWMASLIIDKNGQTQQEINNSNFRVNASILGITPFKDITEQLEYYLNDDITHEIYLPKGEYILSRKIIVDSTHPKKIVFENGAVFTPDVADGVVLFDIFSYLEFENLTFDFKGKGCFTGIRYNADCGLVQVKNTTFKNLKDTDSSRGTTLFSVNAQGNNIDIDGVHFQNCLKRGNGLITDSAGSLNGLYVYGTSNLLGGRIDNLTVEDFHNIDSSENIIYEDTTGLYVATSGLPIPLHVGSVKGKEFGKRLVKLQCSSVKLDYAEGVSETGDSLSVVGVLREVGAFSSNNNIIGTVIVKGNMDAAVADMGMNNQFNFLDMHVYGSNALNDGATHGGMYLGTGAQGSKIKYLKSKAKRPIMFNLELSDIDVKDVVIDHAELETTSLGGQFLNIAGNTTTSVGSLKNLTFKHLTLKNDPNASVASSIMITHNAERGFKNIKINYLEIFDYLSGTAPINLGSYNYVDGLEINNITYHKMNGDHSNTGDVLSLANSKGLKIDKVNMVRNSNRGIYINNSHDVEIGQNVMLGISQIANVVVNGNSSNIRVLSKDLSITDVTNLKEVLKYSGTTAQRPKRAPIGFNYYDTTINQFLTCSSSAVIAEDGTVTADATFIILPKLLQTSVNYDPPSLNAGEIAKTMVTLTGAKIGDIVFASFNKYSSDVEIYAVVSAPNTIIVKFKNTGSSTTDLDSGNLSVKII